MNFDIFTEKLTSPEINAKEIYRYMGAKSDISLPILNECLTEAENVFDYRVCYSRLPVSKTKSGLDLSFCKTVSKDIKRLLTGCDEIILFAATVGSGIDRLIIANRRISPVKSLVFDALGSERAEALCDKFQTSLPFDTTPRFSPGYGDFSLEIQKEIFSFLKPENKIGLTLNEKLLMSPNKSVTAIMGIKKGGTPI